VNFDVFDWNEDGSVDFLGKSSIDLHDLKVNQTLFDTLPLRGLNRRRNSSKITPPPRRGGVNSTLEEEDDSFICPLCLHQAKDDVALAIHFELKHEEAAVKKAQQEGSFPLLIL
jgi:hypothetical protein